MKTKLAQVNKSRSTRLARHPWRIRLGVSLLAISLTLSACKRQPAAPGAPASSDSPAAPGTAAASAPVRKTSFREVTSQLDPDGPFYLYVATDQWLAGLSTNLSQLRDLVKSLPDNPVGDQEQVDRIFALLTHGVRTSGLENLTGVGISSAQLAPELYRTKVVLHHRQGGGEGLVWSLLGQRAHPLRAMEMLPATTALAAFGDLDLARIWNALADALLDTGIPDLERGLREFQEGFQRGTQLPWTNLLASLGGEAGLILTLDDSRKVNFPLGPRSLELPEPGLVVAIKTKNDTLYNRISEAMKGNPQATVFDQPGLKMCVMPLPLRLPVQVQVSVATTGDYFLAASSPELVHAVLATRKGSAEGVAKSAEFKALRQHLPAEGNHFFYSSKRFAEAMLEIQVQTLDSANVAPAQKKVFDQFLGGKASAGLAVGGGTSTGWQLVSVGNQDASGAMLLAPVAGAVAVPAAMLLPALSNAKGRAQSINCVNNLKQVALAFKIWALDNNDEFPFNLSTSKGGTLEFCARGEGDFDVNSFRHFQVMSNELASPKILVCPADPSRQAAASFSSLQAANVSYQVRSGTNVNELHPQEVLARCPIHGHEARCDGSVRQGTAKH